MEVTAAERTTIYTNISPLAQRVNNYIQTQHSSIAAVAKDIGYSRTTVSRYLTGKYDSNPNDLESKLTDFLTRQTGEAVDLTTPLAESEGKTWQTPVFFESRDAKAVLGVCQSCQEYIGLGIVVARSGYGKTYALRQYAKLSRVAYIECDDTMSSRDLVEAIERSIGLPNGYGTIWRRVNGIREFFNTNKGYLLIIDEADKLVSKYTQKKMEILRAVFDQSDVGLVIAGEPKLEAQIKTYLVRMANRVDFYASLRGLSPSEVEGYLTDFQIEPEALVELKARACNMQTGCFRLLDRTLSNVRRILKETGEETVTVKTIAPKTSATYAARNRRRCSGGSSERLCSNSGNGASSWPSRICRAEENVRAKKSSHPSLRAKPCISDNAFRNSSLLFAKAGMSEGGSAQTCSLKSMFHKSLSLSGRQCGRKKVAVPFLKKHRSALSCVFDKPKNGLF